VYALCCKALFFRDRCHSFHHGALSAARAAEKYIKPFDVITAKNIFKIAYKAVLGICRRKIMRRFFVFVYLLF
jgi:hypothetical protein